MLRSLVSRGTALARPLCPVNALRGAPVGQIPRRAFSSGGGSGSSVAIGAVVVVVGGVGLYSGLNMRGKYVPEESAEDKVAAAKQQSVALKDMITNMDELFDAAAMGPEACRKAVTKVFGSPSGAIMKSSEVGKLPFVQKLQGGDMAVDVAAVFDRDGNGTIDTDEFVYGLTLLMILSQSKSVSDTPAHRDAIAKDMFTVVDDNNDSVISMAELQSFIRAAKAMGLIDAKYLSEDMSINDLEDDTKDEPIQKPRSDLEVAQLLMKKFDADHNDTISLDEFITMCQQFSYSHFFQ